MKSDQVNKSWADVLRLVRSGGTVLVEHYNRGIAWMVPADDDIVVLRAASPSQAERLRDLVREHGAVGIPFPNNTTPGCRVVDENGEPPHPGTVPSVEVTVLSQAEPSTQI